MSTISTTRRFQFVGGNSAKFWEITVTSKEVSVCFGRIGSSGQTNIKTFADEPAAKQHAEKMIVAKTKKGYVEVG